MTIYDFNVKTIDGKDMSLASFKGQVVLIVNTASACGFTPQYKGLERLQATYQDRGFAVLGFPCNQFGGQEPGTEAEIKEFCDLKYQVTFPMFAKIDVKGHGAHPLYQYLVKEKKGLFGSEEVKWNFTKFLVNAEGEVVKRYAPVVPPEMIKGDIEALLPG